MTEENSPMEQYQAYAVASLLGLTPAEWAKELGLSASEIETWTGLEQSEIDEELEIKIRARLKKDFGTENLYQALFLKFFEPLGFVIEDDSFDNLRSADLEGKDLSVLICDDGISLSDNAAGRGLPGIFELHEAAWVADEISKIIKANPDDRKMIRAWIEFRGESLAEWDENEVYRLKQTKH
jgi:hypothetical protein